MSDRELIMEIFKRLDDNFFDLGSPLFAKTESEIAADALTETLFNMGLDGLYEREDVVKEGVWYAFFKVKGEDEKNKYNYEVSLNEGYYCGFITIEAENKDEAKDKALNYVCEKLSETFPELNIEVSVRLLKTDNK